MQQYKLMDTDVLVIGSGGAGLRAAIEAFDVGVKVLIISKSGIGKAHTINAEGGVNAALGNVDKEDNWKIHYEDTLKEGHYLSNKKMAEILVKEAIDSVLELARWGLPFNKTNEGKLDQRYFGAHSYRRTCYAADRTGLAILKTLIKQVKKRKIKYIDGIIVTSILAKSNFVYGVTCVNFKTGEFFVIQAKAIILATGGFTRVYKVSTHPEESYGDGIAMAYRIGTELQDMEMIQFHPTGMAFPAKYRGILATEALRGEGAKLYNSKGERFMGKYDAKRMELSARDIIARAIYTEIEEGRGTKNNGVWLDITHLDPKVIKKKLPKMYKQFLKLAKTDITKEKIEVTPTAHYSMGGIKVNSTTTETKTRGLFVAGEISAGLHGANRLGGNSLAETLVFGRRAGVFAAKLAKKTKFQEMDLARIKKEYKRITSPFKRGRKLEITEHMLKEKVRKVMWEYAGVKRDEKMLKLGLNEINKIKKLANKISVSGSLKRNHGWLDFLDTDNMLVVCEAIVRSALMRKESRGAHWRSDYLEKNDKEWLVNIICRQVNGKMLLEKAKVIL
ncbi:MAG: FAD-binding protein [Candidatus Aenigmarchaeota archaeon]|nr:FAD-binding protein [Candidatus Aenigmarchaeota archaeon]